jgi:hypothetical protein
METTKIIYSAFSGTYYEVLEKDVKLLNVGQIPLKSYPPQNCKKCYGRGHVGREQITYAFEICNCVRKKIDFDLVKSLMPQDINQPNNTI